MNCGPRHGGPIAGMGCGYGAPAAPVSGVRRRGVDGFALIVVLFILLIIVGAVWC